MIRLEIKNAVEAVIRKSFGSIKILDFSVEASENPEHGDYATNAALVLAKFLKKPPIEIAVIIMNQLPTTSYHVSAAPPGFINFVISEKFLRAELQKILREKEKYGSGKKKSGKIQVEFISANPTGPLTLANGRGGFLGDALARVLEFSGYQTEREYYVNDTGNQIIILGKSILYRAGIIPEEEHFYKGSYVKEWVEKHRLQVKKLKSDPLKLGQLAANDFLRLIRNVIEKKAKIGFDRYTSENRDIHKKNFTKKVLGIFEKEGLTYKKEGAVWLSTTKFGDDKDRVLMTGDGYPTYFLADSGHYLETKLRNFDTKINILGPDHYGYVARIQASAKIVGLAKSVAIITQAVRLLRDGKEMKMSKRRGEFVTFEDLLKEVELNSARFFFLEKSPDTHIDFDLNLAKERSIKNPVYYVQYAHARMAAIFRKAKNLTYNLQPINYNLLEEKEELALVKKIIQFSEVVEDTARDYQVHRLPRYALELARVFHNFYEKHRVITEEKELTKARLALVGAGKIVLQSVLRLLGVSTPERM